MKASGQLYTPKASTAWMSHWMRFSPPSTKLIHYIAGDGNCCTGFRIFKIYKIGRFRHSGEANFEIF